MNSQEQLKEEPLEEYHVKKRKTKQKALVFLTIEFLVFGLILFIMMKSVDPYVWLCGFFVLFFLFLFASYYIALSNRKKFNFIYYFLLIFVLSALFWSLANKNYNLGYYNSQFKNETELITLTESILNSNLPVEQQQEYLKLLFAQHNAQVEIYQKDLKDNIIFKQDFKIERGVENYKLDSEFGTDIILKQENKKYFMYYTSYKEKDNTHPFLSAVTLNTVNNHNGFYFNVDVFSYGLSRRNLINSLCFFVPFFVLWIFLLIYLNSSSENKKSTSNYINPEFRKEIETIIEEHKDEFDRLK
ncbi:MAG: hypothetical protein K5622_05435 [Endomicrobiaceae bacterium]|nr:hypothetical protein [Endomicrobiaceae bacterium]